MEEKYAELEKRVQVLEELLKGFLQSEDNNINLTLKDCGMHSAFGFETVSKSV